MAATMQRAGDRFATNLYERLGLDARAVAAVPVSTSSSSAPGQR